MTSGWGAGWGPAARTRGVKRELALSILAGEGGAAGGGLVPLTVQFRIAEVDYARCTWALGK